MEFSTGQNVIVASGSAGTSESNLPRIAGLLGNFVGGNLDELGGNNSVGVWRGIDSTYILLAPAFNPEGLAAAVAAQVPGYPVKLYAGPDGRLCVGGAGGPFGEAAGNRQVVAHVLVYQAPSLLEIDLKV